MQRRQDLQNGLDRFKLQLGLPTRLPLELDDGPSRPIRDMLAEFTQARADFKALRDDVDRFRGNFRVGLMYVAGPPVVPLPLELPLRAKVEDLVFNSPMTRSTKEFRADIPGRWDRWRRLTTAELKAELKAMADEFRVLDVRQAAAEARNEQLPAADQARLDALPPEIALGQLELSLRNYEALRPAEEGDAPAGRPSCTRRRSTTSCG